MTFFSGPGTGLAGSSAYFSSSMSRSDILGRRYAPFANPFFDQASTYSPPSVKSLFGFCRFYHLTHGIINAVGTKAAEYPITDLVLQYKDKAVVEKWEQLLFSNLRYRVHQFESNLDYYVTGNAFISPSFPFRKILSCASCNAKIDALQHRDAWRYTNFRFWLTCPKCGQTDYAKSHDTYQRRVSEINLIKWNPENVTIFYNEATGRTDYAYDLSSSFRSEIMMGRKDLVATTPEIFLEAAKTRRMLVFDKRNVYHMRRPSMSSQYNGWGVPLLMPVLKDAFYMQVMKKAQESILLTHLVPQVFLFPQPATAGADPFCVSPETLVETIDGLRPAAEIQEGDWLRSHTGLWRRVEARVERDVPKDEKTYEFKVKTLPGFPFVVSEKHPILAAPNAQRRGGRRFDPTAIPTPEFVEAKNLRVGDFVAYPIHRPTRSDLTIDVAACCPQFASTDSWVYLRHSQEGAEIYEYLESNGKPNFKPGPEALRRAFLNEKGWSEDVYASVCTSGEAHRVPRYIDLADPAWPTIIGYYLAEGSTTDNAVTFTFHRVEDEFVDELCQALTRVGFTPKVDPRDDQNCQNVRVNDTVLASVLRSLCGMYSNQKHIPSVMSEAPDSSVLCMLRCLFNGDGSGLVADPRGTYRVVLKTVSPDLALEARRLLLSFGHIGGISRAVPGPDDIAKQPYYQLYYNGASGRALGRSFGWSVDAGNEVPAQRNAFIRDGYLYMRVAEINETDTPKVIGFQMAGDRTFCVAGVATHNTSVNLADWRDHIRRELARQRLDPSYYGILPFPLGHQIIGENGRQLLLMQEIRMMAEMIITGMGFPVDLVFGQGTYAGSSVNMRMLENFFLSNVQEHYLLLDWVMNHLSSFLEWPKPQGSFKPFKMADDLQRQAFAFQLNQAGKLSDATLLSLSDHKVEEESKLQLNEAKMRAEAIKQQQLLAAEIAGEAMVVQAKYQAKSQEVMMEAQQSAMASASGGAGGEGDPNAFANSQGSGLSGAQQGIPLQQVAQIMAQNIAGLPPTAREQQINMLAQQSPELSALVAQIAGNGMGGQPADAGVDMRPMPQQLPPRRSGAV